MIIDMHCHTKEGSIDAMVDIETYARALADKGFDGMLVTDHNSYRGYEAWKRKENRVKLPKPFVVLKGIEYDTKNGGHMICILPDEADTDILEARGLSVQKLIKLVHSLGGVLGPAHPFDTGYYAFMHTRISKKHPELIHRFDFIEAYNSCAVPLANVEARLLAKKTGKVRTAGSDAHRQVVIGTAYTEFFETITCNNDLIRLIKSHCKTKVTESIFDSMHKDESVIIEKAGIVGYWLYNKIFAYVNSLRRQKRINNLYLKKYFNKSVRPSSRRHKERNTCS